MAFGIELGKERIDTGENTGGNIGGSDKPIADHSLRFKKIITLGCEAISSV